MFDTLRRPLSLALLLAGVASAALLVAIYCIGYTSLSGQAESFGTAFGWGMANIVPWLLALEAGKRAPTAAAAVAVMAGAMLASLAIGHLLTPGSQEVGFEIWRRLPALTATFALVALLRSKLGRAGANGGDIPLLPRQIDWIQAAGNYVELRASGQTVVHRSSISAAERDLANHGFIRIHRSTLVRRDRIARVRPNDVILTDGTHLKIGKRYRATLNS
jgi:DNA-binding LytR/AlgR family response regulator